MTDARQFHNVALIGFMGAGKSTVGRMLAVQLRFDFVDTPAPERRLDQVRVLMAGGAAEEVVFDQEPIGTGSDDLQIADLLGPDDNESALRDEVRRFLALNAGTLRYLASKLGRRGMMLGDEVAAVVRFRA